MTRWLILVTPQARCERALLKSYIETRDDVEIVLTVAEPAKFRPRDDIGIGISHVILYGNQWSNAHPLPEWFHSRPSNLARSIFEIEPHHPDNWGLWKKSVGTESAIHSSGETLKKAYVIGVKHDPVKVMCAIDRIIATHST